MGSVPGLPLLVVLQNPGGFGSQTRFPLAPSDAGQYARHPGTIAIVQNTPFCMLLSLDKKLFTPQLIFDEAGNGCTRRPPSTGGPFNPRNIVVIIVESLGRRQLVV